MAGDFRLWGAAHLFILAAVPASACTLARVARGSSSRLMVTSRVLAAAIVANELIWYVYRYSREGLRFSENLPLQLCDIALWVTAGAAWWRRRAWFEFSYFAGLAGAGMAMVTPDLWAPWPSYPSIYYFLAHGLVMVTVLFLVVGAGLRPQPGALKRFLVTVNAYALVVGAFNWMVGGNYMYLCRKPAGATLLDHLGPWPWYLLWGEVVAVTLCALLYLPFRPRRQWQADAAGPNS